MKHFFPKVITSKIPRKKGYVLLVTFIISAVILTVGLSLAQILTTELQFSSDLLFAEKAYFGAESGVEKALIELKKQPLNHINVTNKTDFFPDESVSFDLNTHNAVHSTIVKIPPLENIKFQLAKDTDGQFTTGISTDNIDFTITPSNDTFSWKIQCNTMTTPVSLESSTGFTNTTNLLHLSGNFDTGLGQLIPNMTTTNFFLASGIDRDSCFMSMTNLNDINDLTVTLENSADTFAPPIARVRSVGNSVSRQKIIEFEYRQKNLSPFFDFLFK